MKRFVAGTRVGRFSRPLFSNCRPVLCTSHAWADSRRGVKIYTKTGDGGESSLFTGERRAKEDVVFHALGTTDELNSFVGLAREYCEQSKNGLDEKLQMIQSLLLDIGANVATPRNAADADARLRRTEFSDVHVTTLEKWIDELDAELPPLKNFILPSGGLASSHLHVCRSVCRRAERLVTPLVKDGQASPAVGRYLNRLSDFLFVAARHAAKAEGKEEVIYKKPKD